MKNKLFVGLAGLCLVLFNTGIVFMNKAMAEGGDYNGTQFLAQENQGSDTSGTIVPEPQSAQQTEIIPADPLAQPAGPVVIQESNSSSPNKISLDIKGMDIVDVLQMVAKRAGMNIAVGKNVVGRVTLFLKDVDVKDAFEIVLLANDLAYEKKGDIVNVMTQRDYELLYGERYQDAKQVKVLPLQFAKALNLANALNQIKSNLGKIVVDEQTNTIVLIDVPDKVREMMEFISKTDVPVQTKIFELNYAQADKLGPKIQEVLTKGVGAIRVDERTNKIAVTDYPAKIEEIADLVRAFDEKTPQVIIDAQIVEISPQKDLFAMGVDWDYWLQKNMRFAGNLPAPSLTDVSSIANKLSFGVAASGASISRTEQYKSVLDLLRVIGETKILSSPRIMALNNQEAKILVGTKEAYITSSVSQTTGSDVTSQAVNFVDVGIKLYVTPTINRDGFVTMKIKPEISSSKRTDIISEGKVTQIPIVTTSEAETTIMVKDGTTIVIAGLKKDKRDKEVKKFPVLGDIPLIGYLFKNTKDEVIKNELVIFLTPHIVSGAEPFEYTSLTKDKDIESIQKQARTQAQSKAVMPPAFQDHQDIQEINNMEDYKEYIYEKIRRTSLSLIFKEEHLRGNVSVNFIVKGDGHLKAEPEIITSTNSRLNRMAIGSITLASPFPSLPREAHKKEESFSIILEYK